MNDNLKVLIIGTDHYYQTGSTNCCDNEIALFTNTLKNAINKYSAVGVFEEMNKEGLKAYKVSSTISQNISSKLGLNHKFVDPNTQERESRGIKDRGKIKIRGLMNGLSQSEIENRILEQDMLRETYWLEEVKKYATGVIIFICGSNHSHSFLELLLKNNIMSEIISNE